MRTPSVGEWIEQERRRRAWSKIRLCDEIQRWEYESGNGDHLGLNPNYVLQWETGKRSVSDYYAPKLSAVLGIPIEVFVDRRTMLKLLGATSAAASLELLRDNAMVMAQPFDMEPTTINVLESLALRYQTMYHSTPPAELMIPVTAHLEIVDDLAKGASGQVQQRILRNHSQVALLAGRLSFFDLRDPMAARAYYSMALDSSREADDPHLSASTLGHMSFVPAANGGFSAAIDLLEGADKYAAKVTILPSWLAAVEAEIRAKAGETQASLNALDRAEP